MLKHRCSLRYKSRVARGTRSKFALICSPRAVMPPKGRPRGQLANLGSVERNGDDGWRVRTQIGNANARGATRPSEAEA